MYIEAFATSTVARGCGLGRSLLQWAEDYAKQKGKSVLWLDCWADNSDLCDYYERAGYECSRAAGCEPVAGPVV